MKDLEHELGAGSIKLTGQEKKDLRESFESQILTAAYVRGTLPYNKYKELLKKRVGEPIATSSPKLP